MPKIGDDTIAIVLGTVQLRSSLDRDAQSRQPVDEQTLVLVLRKDPEVGVVMPTPTSSKETRAFACREEARSQAAARRAGRGRTSG